MKRWICAVLVLTATLSRGDTLVVPNKYANVDSPGAGGMFPGTTSGYQEVFDASDFLNTPPGEILITDFSWRLDNPGQGGSSVSLTLPSVEVFASTTSRNSTSLSSAFGDNMGSDQTLVRIAAPLHISSVPTANEPSPFSITFPFDSPFKYDSSKGNLLIEIHVVNGVGRVPNLDFSTPSGHEGVALAEEGSRFDPLQYAPVTQFSFQSIPEPSSIFLLGLGGIALVLRRFH